MIARADFLVFQISEPKAVMTWGTLRIHVQFIRSAVHQDMRRRALLLVLATAGAIAVPAFAQKSDDNTLDRILPTIRASHAGRLIDAKFETGQDGHAYYRIRWIAPDGLVQDFEVTTSNGDHSHGLVTEKGR